jgi:16S rRNA (cytidine1402-2'-O)-methyltransferase
LGTLYIVATPIGNLEDMTLRAIRVLREVNLIAAEDTRTARTLQSHFEISTPTTSFHDNTAPAKIQRLVERIQEGEDVAIISEAGMPGVSDPGFRLIRAALAAGCDITCVPGPSAAVTALVLSGLPTHAFHFVGFLSRKAGERRRRLESLALEPDTVICYESPHRLLATLKDARETFGPDRRVAVARELTKKFEEVVRGSIGDAVAHFEATEPRGEFTLVIAGTSDRTGLRDSGPECDTDAMMLGRPGRRGRS